jgi:hypothetical protein
MPVVHAELQQANAGGSIRKRRFRMDDERERTKENIGGETPTDAIISFCRALRTRPRLDRQAPIYRRSTAVLA